MYPTPGFPVSAPRFRTGGQGHETPDLHATPHATPGCPQDVRPLITRHRLRRQRRRKAATLLTGASIALGVAALRPPNASAHSASAPVPIAHTERHSVHDPVPVYPPAPG